MESMSSKEGRAEGGYKIYFPEKTFGKATKNRKEDPNMFELLTWGVDGFEKHSFKKDEKFQHSTDAYLNMIGRSPWTSEAHENYLDYQQHCINANPDVLHKIENYIEDRLPLRDKEDRRSPQKLKTGEKPDKKENKYLSNNYLSPKAASSKHLPQDAPKNYRQASIADASKSTKKMKIEEGKMDGVRQGEGQGEKLYGQHLERSRNEEQQELTQNEQAKLIENVRGSPLSSSRPRDGSRTARSRRTSGSRPSRTTGGATRSRSTAGWSTGPTSTRTTCTRTAARTNRRTCSPTP